MKYLKLLLLVAIIATYMSCSKDDIEPEVPHEEEVITTLNYTLTGGGETVTLTFKDLDGDGGNAPTITGGTLKVNTTYTGSMELLNESETPAEDITEEIEEKDMEHQFFFSTDIAGLSIAYGDKDGDNNPVGLATTLTTTGAGSGSLTVILRHEPNKSASGVSDGQIANAGGETDIEVTFPITVQ